MSYPTSIYSSVIKPMTTRVGIHQTIQEIYWRIKLAHQPTIEQEVCGINVEFNVTNRTEYYRLNNFMGEAPIIADLLSEIESDDVVFDVGANIGSYTCFLAHQLSPEQVVAIEPHYRNLAALQSNLNLNNTDAVLIEKALSDTNSTAELAVESEESGEGEHSLATSDDEETIEVDLATGDSLINKKNLPMPSVIKVDVEGAEQRVLQGLKSALAQTTCRLCYVEVHPDRLSDYGDSTEEIESLMDSCGFDLTVLQDRVGQYFLKGEK